MRLELEQDPSTIPFADNTPAEASLESRTADSVVFLREGIRAAQSGNRGAARIALSRAAELDPRSESAWLWLSSISEYPEELFVFLTNVLEINPENARALEWAAATSSLLAKNFVQRGIDAAEANQPDAASQYFNQALEHDEQNPMAWLWLASLSDSNEGKISYLEKVLEFDPENEAAGAAYKAARDAIRADLLTEARTAAVAGNNAEAHELLNAILAEEPNAEDAWVLRSHLANGFEEKIEAFKQILEINPFNASARANLESLSSIMDAVAPKAVEETVTETVEEEVTHAEFAEKEESQVDETPSWMRSAAEDDAPAEEAAYDGTIEVNYSEESSAMDEPAFSPVALVDTDSESEFESPDQNAGYNFAPADIVEDSEAKAEFVPDSAEETGTVGVSHTEMETSVQEEAEEITYELAPDAEPEVFRPESSPWQTQVCEPAESPSPFAGPSENGSAPYDFPTLVSMDMDPEMLASVQNLYGDDAPPVSMPETEVPDHGQPEMPFGMTMIGGRVPEPEENDAYNMPFGMAMMGGRASSPDENDVFNTPFNMAGFGMGIPMPDAEFAEAAADAPTGYETRVVGGDTPRVIQPTAPCSFCSFENDAQAIACNGCMAVLTLADLEMLLANHHADKMTLRGAVERMESERTSREFTETELTLLGIGHLNLRNLQYGYNYLHEAAQLNPNNVVLASQVNALLIRLEEIKQQDIAHESMSRGKKILVVDDSPTVRKLIAGKLEKCGHDVFCSNDGVEAMERLEDLQPDLILLDITMPRMDGYQVCKLIRSKAATRDVPVVMISGKDGFFDKVRGRMAGSSGYITKPFGPETLMKAVETYLKPE